MKHLNSKGLLLSLKDSLQGNLIIYNQTPYAGRADYHHLHTDELTKYRYVDLQRIELYEDDNIFRGMTVTYICDGWTSLVKSHFP